MAELYYNFIWGVFRSYTSFILELILKRQIKDEFIQSALNITDNKKPMVVTNKPLI